LRSRQDVFSAAIGPIMTGSLWSVGRTGSFEEAVVVAANLGEDADTTAAITGQLARALYGASGIPYRWRQNLV
jgi:ADP-ribosyl-[dinitrogen reductase] hydrolase